MLASKASGLKLLSIQKTQPRKEHKEENHSALVIFFTEKTFRRRYISRR